MTTTTQDVYENLEDVEFVMPFVNNFTENVATVLPAEVRIYY